MHSLVLLGLLVVTIGDDTPITPADLFAQFRQNRERFRTLDVQWRRAHRYTEDWRLLQEKSLAEIETRLSTMEATNTDEYRQLHQQAQGLRSLMAGQAYPATTFQTFVGDGTRFMIRSAPPDWGIVHGDDWLMPDVAVTLSTMDRHFLGFTLQSYQGDPNRGFRIWNVMGPGVQGNGIVYRFMQNVYAQNYFPPLATVPSMPNPLPWHPIDAFFQAKPEDFRTVGRTTIDGHELVIVERRTVIAPSPFLLNEQLGNRLREEAVVRAYLDPARGALPLKVEWDTDRFVDGKPLPRPSGHRPERVLEVTEIVEVPGAGFYPSRGRDTTYADDPKHEGPGNTPEGLVAGKVVEVPSVAIEETTWHAAKVQGNHTLQETFALQFPDRAYYYNEITGYSGRVGEENRDGSKLPWTLCGVILAGWAVYGGVAAVKGVRVRRHLAANPSGA